MDGPEQPGQRGARGRWDWAMAAFFGFMALWLADSCARSLIERLSEMWDGQRLTPVFAVYHGYSLYPRAGNGPPVGYTYGPVSVLAYLPVVAASDPTKALLGAELLTLAYAFGPALALLVRGTRGGTARLSAVGVGLLAFAIMTQNPALSYSMMSPVHDAVALGLGLLACLPLIAREETEIGWGPLALSAALAVVAVASKQNAVFYLPSLALYCLLAFGRRTFAAYVVLLMSLGAVLALVLTRIYEAETLGYYLFGVQSRMSLNLSELPRVLRQWCSMATLPLLALGCGLYVDSAQNRGAPTRGAIRERLARNPWVLPLLMGLVNLPISFAASIKFGGALNSLSYSLYFFAAAAAVALARAMSRNAGPCPEVGRRAARALVALACAPWVSSHAGSFSTPTLLNWAHVREQIRENPNQVAYRYAKAHPDSAYFPWNSLAVLMAQGRLFASEDAILFTPPPKSTPSYIAAEGMLPSAPEYIAYPPQYNGEWGGFAVLKAIPGYHGPVKFRGLKGFVVFARVASPP